MFTGIISQLGQVEALEGKNLVHIRIRLQKILKKCKIGSSVSVNGVCLTVTKIQKNVLFFDIMQETLRATNISRIKVNDMVHIEPSVTFGDEVGGHRVSGHVSDVATVLRIDKQKENVKMIFQVKPVWMKYIFDKGFLAINGCSLTVNETNKKKGTFAVWLIPETLRATTFGSQKKGSKVNIEIDTDTKIIVDTVQNIYSLKK